MNYEALGRYTEASEKARSAANAMQNALGSASRLIAASFNQDPNWYVGNEVDFSAIVDQIAIAQSAYSQLQVSVAAANHEAQLCDRKSLKLRPLKGC